MLANHLCVIYATFLYQVFGQGNSSDVWIRKTASCPASVPASFRRLGATLYDEVGESSAARFLYCMKEQFLESGVPPTNYLYVSQARGASLSEIDWQSLSVEKLAGPLCNEISDMALAQNVGNGDSLWMEWGGSKAPLHFPHDENTQGIKFLIDVGELAEENHWILLFTERLPGAIASSDVQRFLDVYKNSTKHILLVTPSHAEEDFMRRRDAWRRLFFEMGLDGTLLVQSSNVYGTNLWSNVADFAAISCLGRLQEAVEYRFKNIINDKGWAPTKNRLEIELIVNPTRRHWLNHVRQAVDFLASQYDGETTMGLVRTDTCRRILEVTSPLPLWQYHMTRQEPFAMTSTEPAPRFPVNFGHELERMKDLHARMSHIRNDSISYDWPGSFYNCLAFQLSYGKPRPKPNALRIMLIVDEDGPGDLIEEEAAGTKWLMDLHELELILITPPVVSRGTDREHPGSLVREYVYQILGRADTHPVYMNASPDGTFAEALASALERFSTSTVSPSTVSPSTTTHLVGVQPPRSATSADQVTYQ